MCGSSNLELTRDLQDQQQETHDEGMSEEVRVVGWQALGLISMYVQRPYRETGSTVEILTTKETKQPGTRW